MKAYLVSAPVLKRLVYRAERDRENTRCSDVAWEQRVSLCARLIHRHGVERHGITVLITIHDPTPVGADDNVLDNDLGPIVAVQIALGGPWEEIENIRVTKIGVDQSSRLKAIRVRGGHVATVVPVAAVGRWALSRTEVGVVVNRQEVEPDIVVADADGVLHLVRSE